METIINREQILKYLPKMGSFTSKPRINQEDINKDEEVDVPKVGVSYEELLRWVRAPLVNLPPLLPRTYTNHPAPHTLAQPQGDVFTVMQWNVLAQALGQHTDNFVKCPSEALNWETRSYRMCEEILTKQPQIICLQEVDHYRYFERVLATQGYSGVFMPKPDSPCIYVPGNNGPDGCAIFYDHNRFKLIDKHTRIIEVWHVQSNQVAILLVLEEISSGRQVMVVTTHLKARQGALLSSLRNEQGKDLLSFIDMHRGDEPLIVCGDFNADPIEPVYTTMTSPSHLSSVYAELNGGSEPAYSTWKIRGDGESCHNIDYFFYTSDSLRVNRGLDAPTEESLGVNRAPSFSYPSDHFSLCVDFAFTKTQSDETS